VNQVTSTLEPYAHAEVVAIRKACQPLVILSSPDANIYCSCEPCPMCLGAIYWARPGRCIAAAAGAAADAGFDDSFIKGEICLPYDNQRMSITQLVHAEALAPFQAWKAKADKLFIERQHPPHYDARFAHTLAL